MHRISRHRIETIVFYILILFLQFQPLYSRHAFSLQANGNPNTPVTVSSEYQYAQSGERFSKWLSGTANPGTTAFMYDGDDVVADYDVPVTGPYVYRCGYIQGNGIDSKIAQVDPPAYGGAVNFYDTDALGSVNQIVDAVGIVQETHLRSAWGEDIVGSTGLTRYGFTQRENDDESGLVYFRARHYLPRLGRFVQRDPIGFRSGSINLYDYVRNNPLAGGDPLGLVGPCTVITKDGKVYNAWTPPVGDGLGKALSEIGEWVKTPDTNPALGAVKGALEGVGNVFVAGIETIEGTLFVVCCPVQTYNYAVKEITTTFIYVDNQGVGWVLSSAAEGLVVKASASPSKFAANVGVGLATSALPAKLPPGLGAAVSETRLGAAAIKLANTEIKALRFLDADVKQIASGVASRVNPLNYELSVEGAGSNLGNVKVIYNPKGASLNTNNLVVPRQVTVIGSRSDTLVAKNWPGHNILDVPDILWSKKLNIKWLDSAIRRGDDIFLGTDPIKHEAILMSLPTRPYSGFIDLELPYLKRRGFVQEGAHMVRKGN
jgi:RHS repeat-associated protein